MQNKKFATRAIHAGQDADPVTGATIVPIYATSTFTQEAPGEHKGYEYSRTGNPTRSALEECLASLEGAQYGLAFASGSAATDAVVNLLEPDDHLVSCSEVYGGTFRLFSGIYGRRGLQVTYVDDSNPESFGRALTPKTRMVWLESPTNPLLNIFDIQSIAKLAHENGTLVVVDNTFATPFLQNPLALGADIVVHSTTKYLNGHSDLIGGAVVTSNEPLYKKMSYYQNAAGAVPSPFDSWLVLRGIKTLKIRMEAHQRGADEIASFLEGHTAVAKVYYPGLKQHPGHDLALKQMTGCGGMVSFKLNDPTRVDSFFRKLTLFAVAESLGGVESLACHPCTMTHATIPEVKRQALGITPELVRLSVGLEDPVDLIDDLQEALET